MRRVGVSPLSWQVAPLHLNWRAANKPTRRTIGALDQSIQATSLPGTVKPQPPPAPPARVLDQVCPIACPAISISFISKRNSVGGARRKVRIASRKPSQAQTSLRLKHAPNRPCTNQEVSRSAVPRRSRQPLRCQSATRTCWQWGWPDKTLLRVPLLPAREQPYLQTPVSMLSEQACCLPSPYLVVVLQVSTPALDPSDISNVCYFCYIFWPSAQNLSFSHSLIMKRPR